jgi:DNA-binding LacI/PurR family transcriptional regulator
MHQDTAKAGERLVVNLLRMIEGEPGESGLIRPALVVRRSCGARED